MFRFETTIARLSPDYCGDSQSRSWANRAASGFDFAHRKNRVHDLIRGSITSNPNRTPPCATLVQMAGFLLELPDSL